MAKIQKSSSGLLKYIFIVIIFIFGLHFLNLQYDFITIPGIYESHMFLNENDVKQFNVLLQNTLSHSISIYVEDEDVGRGILLQDIESKGETNVDVSTGEKLYATLLHGMKRISKFQIQKGISTYSIEADNNRILTEAINDLDENSSNMIHEEAIDKTTCVDDVCNDNENENNFGSISIASGPNRRTRIEYDSRTESRLHPSMFTGLPSISAMPMRVRNLRRDTLDMWYDDGRDGIWQGLLAFGKETATTSYDTHEFFFTIRGDERRIEVDRVRMDLSKSFYILRETEIFEPTVEQAQIIEETEQEEAFMKEYKERTGRLYLSSCRATNGSFLPRPKPQLNMWPADHVGQVHKVKTAEPFWTCKGSKSTCRNGDSPTLELEVVSTEPQALIIKNFLSEFEADVIIEESRKTLHRSSVGDSANAIKESNTRTSRNTWLARSHDEITNSLFLRAADVLQVDEKIIDSSGGGNAEQLQIVHYNVGEKYDPHYDWGAIRDADRFITLLLYLTDMPSSTAGGSTSFPKGIGPDGKPFSVHPGKGSAVLFYNMLPDGNADIHSLHSATAVKQGEKWLANFWVWDPSRKY